MISSCFPDRKYRINSFVTSAYWEVFHGSTRNHMVGLFIQMSVHVLNILPTFISGKAEIFYVKKEHKSLTKALDYMANSLQHLKSNLQLSECPTRKVRKGQ